MRRPLYQCGHCLTGRGDTFFLVLNRMSSWVRRTRIASHVVFTLIKIIIIKILMGGFLKNIYIKI